LIRQAQDYLRSHEWKSVRQHHSDMDLPTTIGADQIGVFADKIVALVRRQHETNNMPGSEEFVRDWRQAFRELTLPARYVMHRLNALKASLEQSIAIQPRTFGRNMVFFNSDPLLRQVVEIKRLMEEYCAGVEAKRPAYQVVPKDSTNCQPILPYKVPPGRGLGLSFQSMVLKQWLEIQEPHKDASRELIMFALACAWRIVGVSGVKRHAQTARIAMIEDQKFAKPAAGCFRTLPEQRKNPRHGPQSRPLPAFSSFKRQLNVVLVKFRNLSVGHDLTFGAGMGFQGKGGS
jgi:hypothetical protein